MKRTLISVSAAALVAMGPAGQASAAEQILKCDLKRHGAVQGTPTELVVVYEKGNDRMVVYDNMMAAYEIEPRLGKVGRDTEKTFVIRWLLDDVKDDIGQVFDIRFTLNWNKLNGKASITGKISFADDHYIGTGKCAFKK